MTENKTCETCQHFCRHYTQIKNFWLALNEGHCSRPHFKKQTVSSPACQHYCAQEENVSPITVKGEISLSICDIPPEITRILAEGL